MTDEKLVKDLAKHVSVLMRAFLVSERQGAPAEGRLPFNPLYFNILKLLRQMDRMTPSDIAADLVVPRTTVSTAIKALQTRDLLASAKSRSDGRSIEVFLTPAGTEAVDAIIRQDRRNAAAMLSALDDSERVEFVNALGRIASLIGSGK